MTIRPRDPYDIPVFRGFDENGDSLYPASYEHLETIEVARIEGSTVHMTDGRHALLGPSEYEVVK